MKYKILLLLIFVSLGAAAQQYQNFGSNGVQRQIIGSDTTFRFNGGASGFLYGKSLYWYRNNLSPNLTFAYGLSLTGTTVKVDSTLIGTKSWVNGRLLSYPVLSGSYSNPSWITSLAGTKITGTAKRVPYYNLSGSLTDTTGFSYRNGGIEQLSGTLTTNRPAHTISQTWNSSGTIFSAFNIDIIPTAYNLGSNITDLPSAFRITKSGIPVFNVGFGTGGNAYTYLRSGLGSGNGPGYFVGLDNSTEAMAVLSVNIAGRPELSFGGGTSRDTYLARSAAGTLGMFGSSNNSFNIFNSSAMDLVNNERIYIGWSANTAYIGNAKLGTGGARDLSIYSTRDIGFDVNDGTRAMTILASNRYVGMGISTPLSKLHVVDAAFGGLRLTSVTTAATDKYGVITADQYDSAVETEGMAMLVASNTVSDNKVTIGGGLGSRNAATSIDFNTGATVQTRQGTNRGGFSSDGTFNIVNNSGFGTTTPLSKAHIVDPAFGGLRLSDNELNNNNKYGALTASQYATSETEGFLAIGTEATSTKNIVNYGGSFSSRNAATDHKWWVATDNVTHLGTLAASLNSSGIFSFVNTPKSPTVQLTSVTDGVAGTDSLLVKKSADNKVYKIPASSYATTASLSNYVDKSSTQTITGAKTFDDFRSTNSARFDQGLVSNAELVIENPLTTNNVRLTYTNITGTRAIKFQNKSYTLADSADVAAISATSGTYTPTITNTSNVASTSNIYGFYKRIGNIVTVDIELSVTATANNLSTALNFSLPIASDFANSHQGTGFSVGYNPTYYGSGYVYSESVNDVGRLIVMAGASATSGDTIRLTFTYSVI